MPGMSDTNGGGDPLYPVLTHMVGRKLTMAEVYDAIGISKARYYEARKEGSLLRPDWLIVAAHHLGINPVELLVECVPNITLRNAREFVEKKAKEAAEFWEDGSMVTSSQLDSP